MTYSQTDKDLFNSKGISENEVNTQIQNFVNGFPFVQLVKPAIINDGIIKLSADDLRKYKIEYDSYQGSILKFVPASGAASRMFKAMFEFVEDTANDQAALENNKHAKQVIENIEKFAFYDDLNQAIDVHSCLKNKEYKKIISHIIMPEGLNYGNLPKGLLKFHSYDKEFRVAIEEHLVEGAMYAKQNGNIVNLHFTVSPEHKEGFVELLEKVKISYEKKYNVRYNISFSEQKPKTDTIAVNLDNTPFREDDTILFRPGGHGALLENLNDCQEDLIFIKNIDNVVVDRLKDVTVDYKKAIAGILLETKKKISEYITGIDKASDEKLLEMFEFTKTKLNILPPNEISTDNTNNLRHFLQATLNKPIRVCGMVRNEGEPGGGPFWVVNSDGTTSLQIIEQAQINLDDTSQKELFNQSTHFNPVDLVCFNKDAQENKINLLNYRDPKTGFISKKSKNGKDLKAQELPGLWNGAMAYWITIFVEVPIETFNPVKTINDLLRPNHQ